MMKYNFGIRTFFPRSLKDWRPEKSRIYQLMRTLTVNRRIFGGFLVLVTMFAMTVPFVLWNNHLLVQRVKQVTSVDTKADRLLLLSSKRIESSRVNLMRFRQNLIPSVQESLNDITQAAQLLAEAEKLLIAQEQNVAVKQVIEILTKYQSLIQQVGNQRGGGGGIESSRLGFTALKTGSDIGFQIEDIVEKNEARVADENRMADTRLKTNSHLLMIFAAGAFILSLILAFFVGRSITVPISELKESAESFQKGHTDFALVVTGTDELSLLALTFQQMAVNLNQNKITLQDRADALEEELSQRRRAETELQRYQENLEDLVKSRTDELGKAIDQMNAEIAERKNTEDQMSAEIAERKKTEEALKQVHEAMAKSTEDLQNQVSEMDNTRKGMLNILEDLDIAKKETEATMQQLDAMSQEQLAIFESLTLGIAFIKDRIILRGNSKLGELFGRTLDEMIGQTTRIWYKNEEEYSGPGAGTYEDLKRQAIHQREQELPRKDGSLFWCLFRARAVDAQDISQGIVCILEDITERKQAEAALRTSQNQMRTLVDSFQSLIFMKDAEGRYLLINAFNEKNTGIPERDVLGKTDFDILPRELAEKIVAQDREVMDARKGVTFEMPGRPGTDRVFLANKVPLINEIGEVYGVCGISTDITDRKRAEKELQEKMEELERFSRLTINREEKMIQLKEEINNLLEQMGKEKKYKIVA
jgi:PAS domain S-box-containing protein